MVVTLLRQGSRLTEKVICFQFTRCDYSYITDFLFLDMFCLVYFDTDLAEMLSRLQVLVCLLDLIKTKSLGINDRSKTLRVGFNGAQHVLQLKSVAHHHATRRKLAAQALQEAGLLFVLGAAQEANDANDTGGLDGVDALAHGLGAGHLHDVVHTAAAGNLHGLGPPSGRLLVVDDVVGAELLQRRLLVLGARRGNDACASGLGKLQGKDAHAAGALRENPLAGQELAVGLPIQGVPCRQRRAGQRRRLESRQCAGLVDETLLVESANRAERTMALTAQSRGIGNIVDRAAEMLLVEERQDLVARLESGDLLADGQHGARAIRTRDDIVHAGEWVLAQRNDEIAVLAISISLAKWLVRRLRRWTNIDRAGLD